MRYRMATCGSAFCRLARKAMGIDWTTRDELAEAIPPGYTEYIGTQLLEHLRERAA